MIDVGGNIRKYRKAKGVTQREIAIKSNVTPQYISLVEKNKNKAFASMETLVSIANALDITVPELLGYEVAECKSLSDYHTDELLGELWRRSK